jgi:tetratricopeptide (TPR) repeat protein
MAAREPLVGEGIGTYARAWARERRIDVYLLQPHSLELELLAERGAIGHVLFGAFLAALVAAIARARERGMAAAALASLTGLVLQSSVDWTWSFPGLVAPVLLVVGAAAARRPRRAVAPGRLAVALSGLAVVAAGAAVLLPYAADRGYRAAKAEAARDPGAAWTRLVRAHRLDPWNADVVQLQADLARDTGRLATADALYARAARLSRRPWVALLERAGVARQLGDRAETLRDCRLAVAANPLEPEVRAGACAGTGPDRMEGARTAKALVAAAAVQGGLGARWR